MIGQISVDRRQPVITAFLFSLLCHLACFSLFTFTLQARSASKTSVAFLGSILTKYDFANAAIESAPLGLDKIAATTLKLNLPKEAQSPSFDSTTQKPLFSQASARTSKQLFKPPLKDSMNNGDKIEADQASGFDTTIPPRIPLKLP